MQIPLFSIGQKGKSSTVTAQSRINMYAEISGDADKGQLAFYGTPGLTLFADFGDTPHRGAIAVGDFIYTVHRGTLWELNNAGVRVNRGSLATTSGRVQMAFNGQQIAMVDGLRMYVYMINRTPAPVSTITRVGTLATLTTSQPHLRYTGEIVTISGALPAQYNGTYTITVTGPTTFTYTMASDPGASAAPAGAYTVDSSFVTVSSGLFDSPVDITFLAGYGVACFQDSGQFQISDLYDFTTWDPLDFATAESNPDNLVRVIADHGELVLFGSNSTEFWANSGQLDFPFSNISGSTVDYGLAARWSLTRYNDSLIGLFKNPMSQVYVMNMVGHAVRKVSEYGFDDIVNDYASVADATGYAYMLGGHPMYQLNFPTQGKSWLFDATTNMPTELQSGLNGMRHRGELLVDYLNKPRVFDYENGRIYTLQPNVYTDNGAPIVREMVSKHFFKDFKRVTIQRLTIDFETGIGLIDGQGKLPQAMLKISRDNGHTWGNEIWRDIGAIGKYLTRVFWTRLGSSRDWIFKIRVTDPVKVVIAAASIDAEVTQ